MIWIKIIWTHQKYNIIFVRVQYKIVEMYMYLYIYFYNLLIEKYIVL